MAREIERKFLVTGTTWKKHLTGEHYRQGYLATESSNSVRVRHTTQKAWLTIKGRGTGITRQEFEYEIPLIDAIEILPLCNNIIIEKIRYKMTFAGNVWEIDEFLGDNAGLVVAEIELVSEKQEFEKPTWAGNEVTHDSRYLNVNLSRHPFNAWENKG